MVKKKSIGTLLLEYGIIGNEELEDGLRLQKETGLRLGEALVKLGKVTAEDIDWILSKQLDIPFVIVDDLCIDRELAQKFPKDFLIKNRILPVYENDEELAIITDDPFNHEAFVFMEGLAQKRLKLSSGSGGTIEAVLKKTLRKGGAPALISQIKAVLKKIENTSFYRIDLLSGEDRSVISIFGCGILRTVSSVNEAFRKEDIFRAFDAVGLPFLYDEHTNENMTFLSIYPLSNTAPHAQFPLVLGSCGLWLPPSTAFTDAGVYAVPHLFHSAYPVPGYPYFSVKGKTPPSGQMVYTVDAAPPDFENYHLKIRVPRKCGRCEGAGCDRCKDLGYEFREADGIYSFGDLKDILRGV